MYIGGNWEKKGGISIDAYNKLIKTFPTTTELKKYTDSRMSVILREFFPDSFKYEEDYKKYIATKKKKYSLNDNGFKTSISLKLELAQFEISLQQLKEMLEHSDEIDEETWKDAIESIIRVLYPKYICSAREVRINGIDKNEKQPDFVMIDSNGYVDVLEVKAANVELMSSKPKYRNNYVPTSDFSGSIQQLEKYIVCLKEKDNYERITKKIKGKIPEYMAIRITNPQGLFIAGRSHCYKEQRKNDFEIIKRQYKDIIDIMTFDDLVHRLENTINALNIELKL